MKMISSTLILLLLEVAAVGALSISRRDVLGAAACTSGALASSSNNWPTLVQPANAENTAATELPSSPFFFSAYQINPDESAKLDPSLTSIDSNKLTKLLSQTRNNRGGAVWLGEHHNSVNDHMLQAQIIRDIYLQRRRRGSSISSSSSSNMAVGLEMVQLKFQPILDAYISKEISDEQLKEQVEWDKRWSWSYNNYLPIFQTCREYNIPLIALNVNSEDLGLVEVGGLPSLSRTALQQYVPDPIGFAEFAKSRYYKTYVDYVISPSYDLHRDMGILRTTITGQMLDEDMSFAKFFSGRILWDESMASNAYKWIVNNPGGLICCLVGADHVKFTGGITGRFQRCSEKQRGGLDCTSIILNPTLIDTRPTGSISNPAAAMSDPEYLTLQLRYLKEGVDVGSKESRLPENTGGVLPLADYIVFSNV